MLSFRGLKREEWVQLESFFCEVEGRRGNFVFLDPTDNLVAWSEDLTQDAWTRDPFLEVTMGVRDARGGTSAARLRNSGPVVQKIEQALAVPGWYQYCLSGWLRSEQGAGVTLFGRTGTAGEARSFQVSDAWRRFVLPVKLNCLEELVRFGLEVEPGQVVEVFGIQVEAQAAPSHYKATQSRCGIHASARLGSDVLEVVAEGADAFACSVTVVVTV
ncbi:MAG: phage head spike fiber domain-containing protein [Bryobacteraceae bacterium]